MTKVVLSVSGNMDCCSLRTTDLTKATACIASTTSDTAKTAAEVLRSLEKAGVSGAQDQHGPGEAASSNAGTDVSTTINGSANAWAAKPQKSALRYKNSADATGAAPQESQPRQKEKKSVRFSEDTKEPATPSQTLSSSPRSTRSRVPKGAGRKARKQPRRHDTESRTTGSELKDMVVPNDESSEDAQLRRDMLRYSLSEVGAVVAELDLLDDQKASVTADDDDVLKQIHGDEGSSADEWTDEDDLDGSEHGDDDEDEEDIYGRSTRRTLSTAYRKEMEALQRRIEARDIQNMGPAGVGLTSTEQGDRSGQVAVGSKRHEDVGRTASPPSDTKTKATATKGRKAKVLSDTIVEHAPAESQHDEDANDAVEAAHSGPKTPVSAAAAAAALMAPSLGPDPLDPALLQQEVAAEYNRMRNRMIYRQGGFLAKGDDEVGLSIRSGDGGDGEVLEQRVPLDPTAEDDDDDDDDDNDNHGDGDIGGIGAGAAPRRNRKMSRFKAARLRQ